MVEPLGEQALKEIAGELQMGMLCFYNKNTGEIVSYPNGVEDSDVFDLWEDVAQKVNDNPGDYFEFDALDSHQSFKVMERFVHGIDHIPTHNKFIGVLSRKKPFANFNNLLHNYPELREQWFPFKDSNYLDYVKEQADRFLEQANTINSSFDKSFCYELEYRLSEAFRNSTDKIIKHIWCDGVLIPTDDMQLSREHIFTNHTIETEAFIGESGQDKYQMTIKLGLQSLKKCKDGDELSDCLPDASSLNWVSLDIENRTIEVQLK
ncbi:UPF0158 family protein [Mucilaginibacter pedocola]|uniref:Uncharacterized protein n=1 Tax=Mucilaginibacter pedocola TaxID=1792845 RepID=A0A1S9P957_9SPHI|nr:UPF0158 family protein [Mucilaginibacter pedocola]OOQ57449.1 hypothetical protein BC343_15250 [Mucilaginibacter pedocola]